ncbi:peptide-methionine (S)-S-oxide reductase MsrA [Phytoactinopolyspora endophytica]|uniref:peptide-methionine (S)-S-oxide reductase MsrA n=1 Tax=Phytoactinopolyspora endophytica TaxID=1642495 RepID=UPI00101E1D29|nr:peptide-methionine (S)-S-oxide reductase MsrA [Phytoactinopolyspora endophytica]
MFGLSAKTRQVGADEALPGRDARPFSLTGTHTVLGTRIDAEPPAGHEEVVFGMGCFWGAEREFWQLPGVWTTAVGYAGGHTPHPTYEEVCSSQTGHAEVVRVVFDPARISYADLLKTFWESHDPTQGMRQGNDVGTQYRSTVYWTTEAQRDATLAARDAYARRLSDAGIGEITTEIAELGDFYYAEDYHQQYLSDAKNPNGYCGLAGTGVACPVGVLPADG